MVKSGKSPRIIFVCKQCGRASPKWLGRCPGCHTWNTFEERFVVAETITPLDDVNQVLELSQVNLEAGRRYTLPMSEFNRVLGGGLVPGSLILIGGAPGIGKSTLLLQTAASLTKKKYKVAYISGEETVQQVKIRAERLKEKGKNLYLLAETDLSIALSQTKHLSPKLAIIDSIQAMSLPELDTGSGSIIQIRECTLKIMQFAKINNIPFIISGHVTKDGNMAGPRVLEHIVDVVLYLEGESFSNYRLLRCIKNRFGTTNEIGVFEMKDQGLIEVLNPSDLLLAQRFKDSVGSVVVPTIEGNRPLLLEIQALTNPTKFTAPRRVANGIDFGRLLLITAVLSRRVGLKLNNQDILINVTGGLRVDEPAADLGIALAIISSYKDKSINHQLTVVGEIGLSGEIRSVTKLNHRIKETARLGFKYCVVPKANEYFMSDDIEIIPVINIKEAIDLVFMK